MTELDGIDPLAALALSPEAMLRTPDGPGVHEAVAWRHEPAHLSRLECGCLRSAGPSR